MIIRHDLKLVFIHVPKCAGKEIRKILKIGANTNNSKELWNYSYSKKLHRYVDMAHLPLSDLKHIEEYKYLDKYTVIACIRNPYMRLRSAVNEFYRQKNKRCEQIVKDNKVTDEMRKKYYKKIFTKHSELDPRYIHSLPMHWFTHYGEEPKIDYILRCENLNEDLIKLSNTLNWPSNFNEAIKKIIPKNQPEQATLQNLPYEELLVEKLYSEDFNIFKYQKKAIDEKKKQMKYIDAGKVRDIHFCEAVRWHWGPQAEQAKQTESKSRRRSNHD